MTSLLLALVMLFTALTLSGCMEKNTVRGGFDLPHRLTYTFICAYEGTKERTVQSDTEFINIEFYYGGMYNILTNGEISENVEYGWSCPSFDLYFENSSGDIYHIKTVEEELVSHKYYVHLDYDEYNFILFNYHYFDEPVFMYHETLAVPLGLFAEESGYILFKLCAKDAYPENRFYFNGEYYELAQVGLFYKWDGDKIIISDKEF